MEHSASRGLDYLLQPVASADFFAKYWERQVLHVERDDRDYFSGLSQNLSLDHTIWQTCHKWGDVSLAGAADAESIRITSVPPSVEGIRRAFASGLTVVINHLERKNVDIAWLCRALEQEWLFDSNVNLYCTKAGTQGLGYHYDDDDVFILQVGGSKLWRIYDTETILPLADDAYRAPDCAHSSYTEYLLRPGDTLYFPRGFVHEARALNETSVHLTLTVSVIRWVTLLHRLIDNEAQNNLTLRRAIPVDLLAGRSKDVDGEILELVGKNTHASSVLDVLAALGRQLVTSKPRIPTPGGPGIESINDLEIEVDSSVEVAADQVITYSRSGDEVSLNFIGGSICLAADLELAVEHLCSGKPTVVRDIPGELTSTEKLDVARLLVSCGLLRVL